MSLGFFAFHAFWLGSSWLYSTTDGGESFSRFSFLSNIPTLSQDISQQIPIGKRYSGNHFTNDIFMPSGFMVQLEDFIYLVLSKFSSAIRDSIISKFWCLDLLFQLLLMFIFECCSLSS